MKETNWIGKSGGKVSDPANWDNGVPDHRTKAIFDVSERTEITWDLKGLGIPVELLCDPEDVVIYISGDCLVGGSYFVPDAIQDHFEAFKDETLNPDELDRPPPGYGMFQQTETTWTASSDGNASQPGNWTAGVPQDDYNAIFDDTSNYNCTWNISPNLNLLIWTTDYTGTLKLQRDVIWDFAFNPSGGEFDTDSKGVYVKSLKIGEDTTLVTFSANDSSIEIGGNAQVFDNRFHDFVCGSSVVTISADCSMWGFYNDTKNNHFYTLILNISITLTLMTGTGVRNQATINGEVLGNEPNQYLAVGYDGHATPLILGGSGDVDNAFIQYINIVNYSVVSAHYGRLTLTISDTGSLAIKATLQGDIIVSKQLLIGTNTTYTLTLDTTENNYDIETRHSADGSIDIGTSGGGRGAIEANGSMITVETDFNIYNTYTAMTSTIEFTTGANRAFKTNDQELYNVTCPTGGNTYTVTGDLIFSGTLLANNNIIKVDGDWTNTGTFTKGTSTVELNGSTSSDQILTSGGDAFNNLTFNNSDGTAEIIVADNLNVDGTFALANGQIDMDDNNPAINTAGAVTFTNGCTLTHGSGTWTFDSTLTYTDGNGSAQNIGDIVIGSGVASITVTLATHIRFIDITILSGCTFASGNQAIYCEGDWSNNGTFTMGTCHVHFEGTSTITGMLGSGLEAINKFYDVTVKTGCTATTDTKVSVTGIIGGTSACFTADGPVSSDTMRIEGDCTIDGTFHVSQSQTTDVCD